MTDTDPFKQYVDARTSLRDTAKWIVTILGATVVLVIGGGLIAKIADLELGPRLIAAACLLALAFFCTLPLTAAIDIVAAKLTSLKDMAHADEFKQARAVMDKFLEPRDEAINSVARLYGMYCYQSSIAKDAAKSQEQRDAANKILADLQPYLREALEITNTEYLRLKFEAMLRKTRLALPLVGVALFVFLISSHKDDAIEKALAKPVVLQIPWSAGIEAQLKKAGMPASCYLKDSPSLLQITEKSGLRAGVLVIPHDLSEQCPAVRVIVTSSKNVFLSD